MHDLLHDVATSVMEHELHLIQPGWSLDGAKNCRHVSYHLIQPGWSLDGAKNCRHVSYSTEVKEYGTLMKDNSKIPSLRSFFFTRKHDWFARDGFSINYGKDIVEWLSNQKHLRILRLDYLKFEKLPISLSKHLRYLDVSRSSIKRLPESTSSLHKLQTLNLRFCQNLKCLPKSMKEMKSLVYLDIRGCDRLKRMPPGMGQLKGMRKLSKFIVGKKDGCKIGELKELNGLEGELSIRGLCNVKSVADFKSANLMEKNMLTSLELIAFKENNHFDVEALSVLQPHQKLRKLLIRGYGSLELPGWMMDLHVHLPNLVEITLTEFSQCQQLPIPLGRLDSLKVLELRQMSCLEHIGVEVYGDGERAAFPSLEKLTLHRMRSLKEWAEITTSASSSRAALPFPCLRELSIGECPLLTKFLNISSVPDLSIRESITTSQLAVLIQSKFIGLRFLSVYGFDQLESLPELGPHHNLCSLETLRIHGCRMLQSLPSTGLWCSSSLCHLSISNCSEFITLSDDGLRHLTALQELYLYDCPKMTSLPESIQHLTALQTLRIWSCEGLSCLPDGIGSLTTLVKLDIYDCPALKRRCEKDKGEDWPKIAHIPSIWINDKQIQGDEDYSSSSSSEE